MRMAQDSDSVSPRLTQGHPPPLAPVLWENNAPRRPRAARREGQKHSIGPALPASKETCSSHPSGDYRAVSIRAVSLEPERSQDALGRRKGVKEHLV